MIAGVRWSIAPPRKGPCDQELDQPSIEIGPGLQVGLSADSVTAMLGPGTQESDWAADLDDSFGPLPTHGLEYFPRTGDRGEWWINNNAVAMYEGEAVVGLILVKVREFLG